MEIPEGATKGACGEVSDIRFHNISSTSENGIFLGCDTPGKINDITIDNVNLRLLRSTSWPTGVYDRRPCDGEGFISSPTYGIYTENIKNLKVTDFNVEAEGFPNYAGLRLDK